MVGVLTSNGGGLKHKKRVAALSTTTSPAICQSWIPGNLQMDLYTAKGKKEANLYLGKIKDGVFMITWDGKDPANKTSFKGDYKIRWTIGTGYREFPITIN